MNFHTQHGQGDCREGILWMQKVNDYCVNLGNGLHEIGDALTTAVDEGQEKICCFSLPPHPLKENIINIVML